MTGPRSRDLLAGLTEADLSDGAFPFARARRSTWAGRRRWPCASRSPASSAGSCTRRSSRCRALYDQLVAAGAPLGLRHAGYRALDGLRAEKGYVHWGADAGPADTPAEAGLAPLSRWTSRAASSAARRSRPPAPPRRRLVPILLADPEPLLYHGESVLQDGRVVGRVTSGAYGHTLGAAVGLAALEGDPAAVDAVSPGATWRSRSPASARRRG